MRVVILEKYVKEPKSRPQPVKSSSRIAPYLQKKSIERQEV